MLESYDPLHDLEILIKLRTHCPINEAEKITIIINGILDKFVKEVNTENTDDSIHSIQT